MSRPISKRRLRYLEDQLDRCLQPKLKEGEVLEITVKDSSTDKDEKAQMFVIGFKDEEQKNGRPNIE